MRQLFGAFSIVLTLITCIGMATISTLMLDKYQCQLRYHCFVWALLALSGYAIGTFYGVLGVSMANAWEHRQDARKVYWRSEG